MSKRNRITYNRPDPPFLRRIREQVGYQESPDVNTKVRWARIRILCHRLNYALPIDWHYNLDFQLQESEKNNDRESGGALVRDGEEPTYVLSNNSNVSEAEAKHFINSQKKGLKQFSKLGSYLFRLFIIIIIPVFIIQRRKQHPRTNSVQKADQTDRTQRSPIN